MLDRPQDLQAWLDRAERALHAGQWVEARDLLQSAAQWLPRVPQVHHFLGSAHLALGQASLALESAQRALALAPGQWQSQLLLGRAYKARGQMEAARSIGLSSRQAMLNVILPQAVVRMIPPLGNEFIALIKNSALVSLLTIHDLMHEGQKIISVSYRSLEVYLAIALMYFVLTGLTTLALRHVEQRLRAGGMVQ